MKMYLEYIVKVIENYLRNQTSNQSIAEAIKEYADRHYAEDISRGDLADIFYLDSDYASRLFKEAFGISFKNYVIHKRIEAAKDLLVHTDLPINTVADSVGYGNYSYFTRIFKKVTHVTPIEFREKMKFSI